VTVALALLHSYGEAAVSVYDCESLLSGCFVHACWVPHSTLVSTTVCSTCRTCMPTPAYQVGKTMLRAEKQALRTLRHTCHGLALYGRTPGGTRARSAAVPTRCRECMSPPSQLLTCCIRHLQGTPSEPDPVASRLRDVVSERPSNLLRACSCHR
jgi:hypothetical protein